VNKRGGRPKNSGEAGYGERVTWEALHAT
jgi:hypothetical protein